MTRPTTPITPTDASDLLGSGELPSAELVRIAANAIWDKKGFDVVAMRVREIVQYTDYIVVCSASSDRQTVAIADHVEDTFLKERRLKTVGIEGRSQGRWILLDFGDIVVHVFHRPVREYYQIERLYADAPRLVLETPAWLAELSPDALLEQDFAEGDARWLQHEEPERSPTPRRWHEQVAAAAADEDEEDEFEGEDLTDDELAQLAAWDAESPPTEVESADDDEA